MAFNGRFVLNLIHFVRKHGVPAKDLLIYTGRSESELTAEDCIVDEDIYNKVVEEAVRRSQDNCLGLHAGENLNLSAAGLVTQLVQTSETVRQALELSCTFANLGCSALPLALVEKKDSYQLTLTPNPIWAKKSPIAVKHTASGLIGFTIRQFHSLTLMRHHPIKIHLSWATDNNRAEYERVFGCPVVFNQPELAIFLPKSLVEEKIITSDYSLQKVLLVYATEKSNRLLTEKGFAAVVKESVVLLIQSEFPAIDQVASHLNMSPRSLQRKLAEENSNFKALTESLKNEFAIDYMKQQQLSIGEVAYLLGYADVSSFTRAFKKWEGKTPTQFRNQHFT